MSDRFVPGWRYDRTNRTIVCWLSSTWVYTASFDQWEKIWRAYVARRHGGQGLQINQICRKFEIARKTFEAVKKVIGLTHTSVPYPPWVMEETPSEQLVERTLSRREEDYETAYNEHSIDWFRREWEKLKKEQISGERIVTLLASALRDLPASELRDLPERRKFHGSDKPLTALLPICDWHLGRMSLARQLVASDAVNLKVLKHRVECLTDQVVSWVIAQPTVRELVVPSLGDMTDNPMSDTFYNQAAVQDARDVEQVREAVRIFRGFFDTLLENLPVSIRVLAVRGNHGPKGRPLSGIFDELLFDPMLKTIYASNRRIQIDTTSALLLTHRVGASLCAFTHGAGLRRFSDAAAYRMAAIAEFADPVQTPAKWRYLFMGHNHQFEAGLKPAREGVHIEWIRCPSLVGTDEYGEQLLLTHRPAQFGCLIHPTDGLAEIHPFYLDGC